MLIAGVDGRKMSHNERGEDIHHPLLGLGKRATTEFSGVETYASTPQGLSTQTKVVINTKAQSPTSSGLYTGTSTPQSPTYTNSLTSTSASSPTSTSSSNNSDTTSSWISGHKLTLAGIIAAFLALSIAIAFVLVVIYRRARKRRTEEEKARQSFFAGTESAMLGATIKTKKTISRGNSLNRPPALEMSRRGSGKRYWGGLGSDDDERHHRIPMPNSGSLPIIQGKGSISATALTRKPSLKSARTDITAASDASGVERPPSVAPSIPAPPASSPFTVLTEAFKSNSDESHDSNPTLLRDAGPSVSTVLRKGPDYDPSFAGGILSDLKLGNDMNPPIRTPIRLYTPSTRSNVATIEGTGFPLPPPSPSQPAQIIPPALMAHSIPNPGSPHRPFDTTPPPPSTNSYATSSPPPIQKPSKAERRQNIRALEDLIAALDDAGSEGGSISLTTTSLSPTSSNAGTRYAGSQSPIGTRFPDASMWKAALGSPGPNID